MRIVIVIKSVGDGRFQASLRSAAGANPLFYSRRDDRVSKIKRDVELLFGPLEWQDPPAALKKSEPEVLTVAYWNGPTR